MTHLTCALKRSACFKRFTSRHVRRALAPRRHRVAAVSATTRPVVDPFTLMLYAYAIGSLTILVR